MKIKIKRIGEKMLQEREEFYYEEDELSLYDIVNILLKYKKMIISIFLIGLIASFGLALSLRNYNRKESANQEFRLMYNALESNPYYQMINLTYVKFNPSTILQNEKYLNSFFEIKELRDEFYKSKNLSDKFLLDKKIEFLSKIIKLENKDGVYSLKITANENLDIVEKISEIYFSILNEEIPERIKTLIETEKIEALVLNDEATKKLESIKKEINLALSTEKNISNMTASDIRSLISFKEPLLAVDNAFYQSVYDRTSKQIIGTEEILKTSLIDNIIEKTSSLIIKREAGIAKYILLGGIIFTILIIIILIIVKEFRERYKKYKLGTIQK